MSTRIQEPAQQRRPDRRLWIAVLLVAPAVVFVGANVLQYGLGVPKAADWLNPLFTIRGLEWLSTAWVLAGPAVAFLLAASRLLPIRLLRDDDAWEVRIRVRADIPAITIAALSLFVGGILAAHLVAENLACAIGIRSSC
jgi:hypothetical protein